MTKIAWHSVPKKIKPSLVFLHGLLGSSQEFVPYLKHFEGQYAAYALDAPLHGRRDQVGALTATSLIADLEVQLSPIPTPYILVGHSLGGLVALRYGALHPERVVGGVVLDIFPYQTPFTRLFHATLLRLFSERLAPEREVAPLADVLTDEAYRLSVDKYLTKCPRGVNPKERLARLVDFVTDQIDAFFQPQPLSCPLLFLVGEGSPFSDLEDEVWQRDYPQAARRVIAEGGHLLHITQRAEVIAALEAWLAGL